MDFHPIDYLLNTCYPCIGSLKREWNNEVCSGTESDCGRCLEGYFEGSAEANSECLPSREINVTKSKISYVPDGATVNLKCAFAEHVSECVWERRGQVIEIGGRYQYIAENKGSSIKDCSIRIKKFKEIDVGEWECSSPATSNTYPICNLNTILRLTHGEVITVDHNHYLLVPVGE